MWKKQLSIRKQPKLLTFRHVRKLKTDFYERVREIEEVESMNVVGTKVSANLKKPTNKGRFFSN